MSADIDDASILATLPSRQRDSAPLLANFVLGQEQGPGTCHFSRSRAVTTTERYIFTGTQGSLEAVVSSATHPATAPPALTVRRFSQRPQPVPLPDYPKDDLPAPVYRMRAMIEHLSRLTRAAEAVPATSDARSALEVVHGAYLADQDARKVTLPLRRSPQITVKS